MGRRKQNGYQEGYVENGEDRIKHFDPDLTDEKLKATIFVPYKKNDRGFQEGYVDNGEKIITPYNPELGERIEPIPEIIIVPTSTGGLLFAQYVMTVNVTVTDGNIITLETFTFLPLQGADMWITVNGLTIYPANGASEVATSAFYITDSTGLKVRPNGDYSIGDIFRWNGSVANYQLDNNDKIKIIYEV